MAATLRDLIQAGALKAGEQLTCEPRQGEVHRAVLNADGTVSSAGEVFDSPSAWASKVAGNSRNGWRDVVARSKPLAYWREKYQGPIPPPPPPSPPPPTHTHSLDEILEEHNRRVRATLQNRVNAMQPEEFQQFCGKLMEGLGYTDVKVGPRGADGGVDGEGKQRRGVDTIAKFQAKKWDQQIGRPEIDRFRGAIEGSCHRGVFFTTSRFSDYAHKAANVFGRLPIDLFDREAIVNLMIEKRIGVCEQTLTILRVA